MRRVGVAVKQLDGVFRPLHEGVVDLALRKHRAHGQRAVGQSLGGGHQVGRHIESLRGKRLADSAEAGDHLVEYQQNVMPVADLAQALQVADRRQYHAGGAGNRFDDDRGDGRGVMQGDQALELVGEMRAPLRQPRENALCS